MTTAKPKPKPKRNKTKAEIVLAVHEEPRRASNEDFVRIWQAGWQAGDSLREIARRAGTTPERAKARAVALRSKGVPLKRLRPRTERIDVAALKKIAEETSHSGKGGSR